MNYWTVLRDEWFAGWRVSAPDEPALAEAIRRASVEHRIQRVGSMFSVFFREGEVRDYDDARAQDPERFGRFFHAMLRRGVHLPPSCYEVWFVSAAHDDAAVEAVVSAIEGSAAEIA